MGSRSLLSSSLWSLSLLLVCCAVCGCLTSAALASGVVGVYVDRPLANAYSSLWPCLALLYFGYLAALEQTPDALQESATFVLTQTPARSRHLRRLMLVLLALSIPICIILMVLGLCSDWASITFGLVFPCLLLGFFSWHVAAYTAEYQSSQGPSKVHIVTYYSIYYLYIIPYRKTLHAFLFPVT